MSIGSSFSDCFAFIVSNKPVSRLFVFKRELSSVSLLLVLSGFAGALIAANWVHPHTAGLSDHAKQVLEEHETHADLTIWLAGFGLGAKIFSHFLLKRQLWAEIIAALVLIVLAYSVSVAGHLGTQLAYIEGIGTKGKYLETHESDHEH